MINLFDDYSEKVADLHSSLKNAGYKNKTIVLNDDGFLPEGVTSPYQYFLGEEKEGLPKYFNQVKTPLYWELKGDNSKAEICDLFDKRADIYYINPGYKRLVKVVEWRDDKGRFRLAEHYNKHGRKFAVTNYNANEERVITTYYDVNNKEKIVENHVTGDIIVNEGSKITIFKSKKEFYTYYLKNSGLDLSAIAIPSLASTFSLVYNLGIEGKDVLFWQEPLGDEIPGNMRLIFEQITRIKKVIVQDKKTYDKLLELADKLYTNDVHRKKIFYLGQIYNYKRDNKMRKNALIFTNSDNIEKLTEVVRELPEVNFKIAAITEMSPKLQDFGNYDNVASYPNVTLAMVEKLKEQCDIYLDINHANEILDATKEAFLNNSLILAFEETLHNSTYVAKENIFSANDYEKLAQRVKEVLADKNSMEYYLELQRKHANDVTIEDYKKVLG